MALFVVSRPGDRFEAIERPAAVSGLPVVRAGREIDPQLLRSAELGFLNGHVPVTGIISAIAVLAAVLGERDAVVMSNEWSASVPTLEHDGRPVNHQYSKSAAFEAAFRDGRSPPTPPGCPTTSPRCATGPSCGSAERFAGLTRYHGTFRSCNRAFHIDTVARLDHWCGQCDKCCFIDLILAPFMSAEAAARGVRGRRRAAAEPLDNPELAPKFRALLGSGTKPFECVGEVNECRAAVVLAARRADRAGTPLLQELAAEVAGARTRRPRPRSRRCGARWARASSRRYSPSRSHDPASGRSWAGPTCAAARVGVWGLGREGEREPAQAALARRRARARGRQPHAGEAGDEHVLATADGGLDALLRCEVVIKTPGISSYSPQADRLRQAGVMLAGGLGLWLQEADRDRVVCVTGTKGKSTTSSILGHLLTGLGYRAMVGGNIGAAPYDPALAGDCDYWVIEVSSYRRPTSPSTPPVTAVTSLHPDHLPWHGGVEQYYRDKLSACSQPGAELTVANGDSELLRDRAGLLAPRVEWVLETDEPGATWMDPLGLPGRHNRRNALIARRVLRALGGAATRLAAADDEALRAAAAGFERAAQPPRHRSARWTGSASSTTACPPTCCRRSPPSTLSPAAGSR